MNHTHPQPPQVHKKGRGTDRDHGQGGWCATLDDLGLKPVSASFRRLSNGRNTRQGAVVMRQNTAAEIVDLLAVDVGMKLMSVPNAVYVIGRHPELLPR